MSHLNSGFKLWLSAYHEALAHFAASGQIATADMIREGLATLTATYVTHAPDVARVIDTFVPAASHLIPVRMYHPAPHTALPVLLFLHGGGHLAGSVAVYDSICRKLADATRQIVVAVDYRLAPESPYPAGLEDARQVLRQLVPLCEQHQLQYQPVLSLVGDSAGGAMAATLSADCQSDPDIQLVNQVLIYPSLDYTMSLPSVVENGTGLFLQQEKIRWYFDQYFQNGEDRRAASPLFMPVSKHFPRTLVITAQYCPLRDEGAAYVQWLSNAGVPVQQYHLDDMIHAYLNLENLVPARCEATYRMIADFLATPRMRDPFINQDKRCSNS
ncbi:alpha/beta hydrolase [Photobacterium sp. 1_MG-2023]|uniref:alpha/beta hydrolase n=1 Tax=Photobacterium sp. 1_MG-2023 TaxID=3062646 RepID=UPI0026E442EA|nr:alpha/beta hydrolase [Photobacterium sp. 1_MG-2023]MDO6705592.1 alpha/beta hydrolase [Photobacterium sp. 1_MG-2023]